jgi:enoyl-CoA hydratase/carnithine racemase
MDPKYAVVPSGDGRAFCAGLDLQSFDRLAQNGNARIDLISRTHGIANIAQHLVLQWRQLPVPVIAAVQGVAMSPLFILRICRSTSLER